MWMNVENPAPMGKSNLSAPKRAALGDLSNFANKASNTKFKTAQQDMALDGVYTGMRQRIPVASNPCVDGDHIRNVDLCRGLPRVVDKVRARMTRLAGHCARHLKVMADRLTQGTARRGERRSTYVDTLQCDSRDNDTAELLMLDRKLWRSSILESRRTGVARVEAPPQVSPSTGPEQAADVSMKEEEELFWLAFPDPLLTVEDIDAGDSQMTHLCSEYVKDIYAHLMDLEVKHAVRPGYLKGCDITAHMRAKLIDWLIQVQSSFQLRQETLYLTVAILDHFLQARSVSPKKLQLVGVASMLLASKYEDRYTPRIQDCAYITENAFTTSQIKQMERVVLRTLNYELGFPLPLLFLRRASKAASCTVESHMLAKYLLELTLLDYNMVHYRPSEVAAASLCLSQLLLGGLPWTPTEQHYTTYDEAHLKPIMQHIAKNVVNLGETEFQAVKMKYRESKLMDVTCLSELQSSVVKSLAAPLLDNHGVQNNSLTAIGNTKKAHAVPSFTAIMFQLVTDFFLIP